MLAAAALRPRHRSSALPPTAAAAAAATEEGGGGIDEENGGGGGVGGFALSDDKNEISGSMYLSGLTGETPTDSFVATTGGVAVAVAVDASLAFRTGHTTCTALVSPNVTGVDGTISTFFERLRRRASSSRMLSLIAAFSCSAKSRSSLESAFDARAIVVRGASVE